MEIQTEALPDTGHGSVARTRRDQACAAASLCEYRFGSASLQCQHRFGNEGDRLSCLALAQRRRQFTLEELDKGVLLRADLDQDDMVEARLDVAIDRLEMRLG